MNVTYTTLEKKHVALIGLNLPERRFLGRLMRQFKDNASYLDFENSCMDPASPVFSHANRLGRAVQDTALYEVCDDLGKRLGLRQGFLVREEVVARYARPTPIKELTTGEVARLAKCTDEAVRKAIRTQRLRARRVGRYSLIAEADALAFAEARKSSARVRRSPKPCPASVRFCLPNRQWEKGHEAPACIYRTGSSGALNSFLQAGQRQ